MSNRDVALEWVVKAEENLRAAQYLMSLVPLPIDIVAYLLQQSVELILKSVLVLEDKEVPKTHNLVILGKRIENRIFMEKYSSILERMTAFAVEIRYPNSLEVTKEMLIYYLEQASKIVQFIKKEYFNEKKLN